MNREDIDKIRAEVDTTRNDIIPPHKKHDIQTLLARAKYSYESGAILNMQDESYIKEITKDLFARKDYMLIFLPIGAKVVKEDAFEGFTELITVMVGDQLERVEDRAFSDCVNLPNITIPNKCVYESSSFPEDCVVVSNTQKCQASLWEGAAGEV